MTAPDVDVVRQVVAAWRTTPGGGDPTALRNWVRRRWPQLGAALDDLNRALSGQDAPPPACRPLP